MGRTGCFTVVLFTSVTFPSSVEETESHVVVLLFGLFLLLLLLGGVLASGRCSGGRPGGGSCGRGRSGPDARAHVRDERLQAESLERLGEQAGPVRLNLDACSLEDRADLLSGDCNLIVLEDKGAINARELVVGWHYDLLLR
uniref:Uncharacterized protein n=1 Tax=Ixodes ricinus TaxID=34613 RepID=A0A6B0UTH0_IXORI